jgi:hypothetical protein
MFCCNCPDNIFTAPATATLKVNVIVSLFTTSITPDILSPLQSSDHTLGTIFKL